jgi:hypothetical protein
MILRLKGPLDGTRRRQGGSRFGGAGNTGHDGSSFLEQIAIGWDHLIA